MTILQNYTKRTPIITNEELNDKVGCELFFKCENLQITGSFKFRGAVNAILSLTDEQKIRGVITVSSGNHGAAIAKACKIFNVKAHIIVPKNSSPVKIANIQRYGAEISYCGNGTEDRKMALDEKVKQSGHYFIPAYNDLNVIKGQSTIAKEMLEDVPDLDIIIAPLGGGGLMSGTILARDSVNKSIEIYGAEPLGANDAALSLESGEIITLKQTDTICDGLRAGLGDVTYPIIKSGIKSIITVEDKETLAAMRLIWENLKIIIEPSSAIALAAVLKRVDIFQNKKVGLILTGGNISLDKILWSDSI